MHRWDIAGLVLVGLFGASLFLLEDREPAERADALLADPSTEVQLGDEWMGLYFKGRRAGLLHLSKRARPEGGYLFDLRTKVRLLAFNSNASLDTEVQAALDPKLTLERFTFRVDAGPASLSGSGTVEGKTVRMSIRTGGERIDRTLELPEPPVLKTNLGPLLSRKALKPGEKFSYEAFDPLTQANQTIEVEVVGPDEVIALGQAVPVTHVRQRIGMLALDGWMNQRGEMIRQELGMGLVALRETEEEARWGLAQAASGDARADLVSATMIEVPGLPADLEGTRALSLRLGGLDVSVMKLDDRRQKLDRDVLTIVREEVGAGLPIPVKDAPDGSLKAESLVQSDHPRMRDAARRVVGDAADTVEAAQRLRRWIHDELEQKAVVGVPSALETLNKRVGDCNEHATLFAALARAAGVPARIAVGLAYQRGRFGYHAWNEVLTADGWLSVDPTWDQLPADVGHLRIVSGGLERQVELLQVMGRLELSVAD